MLGRYVSINGEILPNPVSYSESKGKIANTAQSESGKDLVMNVRIKKYTGNFTFNVSSYWKEKLEAYYEEAAISLVVGNNTYNARIEEFDAELVENSERADNTDGYWVVTFSAIEY